jgi:hypothetical protein
MANNLIAVQVEDVNGDPAPDAEVLLFDRSSGGRKQLPGTVVAGGLQTAQKVIFDLGNATSITIELKAPKFFGYSLDLKRDIAAGKYQVNARSPIWGLYTSEASGEIMVLLRLIALRVRKAPRQQAALPSRDIAPPVVDDPAGIWIDGSFRLVNLCDGKASRFPAILGREILGDAEKNNWERFRATETTVDPAQADSGNHFEWLEYGDPGGFRMLIAVWEINRAGARADGKMDFHFFFGPRTDIDFYSPPSIYPYKRKRILGQVVQPFAHLGYLYLSAGCTSDNFPDSGAAIAYQGMASRKSHVVVMPINAAGFFGPLLCRQGLHRLAREVAAYVSDNTWNTLEPSSEFSAGNRQTVNRIAVSGYSSGGPDAHRLFRHNSIAELLESYHKAKADAQSKAFAKRLEPLNTALWRSPVDEFDRKWAEFYSVDAFYGSNSTAAFPAEFAPWFARGPDRILRVYATTMRMKSAPEVIAKKLADVFRGVTPKHVERAKDPSYSADEWHRSDGRASLAWFSSAYMTFSSVPYMPTELLKDGGHHTIPRVVFSHALAQSKLLDL